MLGARSWWLDWWVGRRAGQTAAPHLLSVNAGLVWGEVGTQPNLSHP